MDLVKRIIMSVLHIVQSQFQFIAYMCLQQSYCIVSPEPLPTLHHCCMHLSISSRQMDNLVESKKPNLLIQNDKNCTSNNFKNAKA